MAAIPTATDSVDTAETGAGLPRVERASLRAEGSHVRARTAEPAMRARRRVIEYLKVLGLEDSELADGFAASCVEAAKAGGETEDRAGAAMRVAQARFTAWRDGSFEPGSSVDPLWLRAFLSAHPEAFFAAREKTRALAASFGDPSTGSAPKPSQFREQRLEKARFPRWIAGLLPALVGSAVVTTFLGMKLLATGFGALELAFLAVFSVLFVFVAIGFSTSILGLFSGAPSRLSGIPTVLPPDQDLLRTVLVVPVYHESAEHVFAAVLAMRESLLGSARVGTFEIFVLSDSQDPLIAADEERAFRRVSAVCADDIPVYYRRRSRNLRQKAGNIAEFFERFGHRYKYALILDADSLMAGSTVVELVRRMEASPEVALLQAPIQPVQGETLLARSIQWASSISGPLLTRGLAVWAGSTGNYYGHNALVRVRAFLDCCALPTLAGEPPLGGHILSHDFVEAALLRRRGYAVRMATDLGGSYEGLPPTLGEYVARDRRWCQGNLQHLRVASSAGLAPMSRIHMLLGAGAYLASPLWLAFLVLGLGVSRGGEVPRDVILGSWIATAALLMGPRLFGVARALTNSALRRAHGGSFALLASAAAETAFSALLAPLMMLHHTKIVLSILLGRSVRWGRQGRHARAGLSAAVRGELPATILGLGVGGGLLSTNPSLALWVGPVWVPLCLSIGISMLASSARVGRFLARCRVLLVPSETEPDEVIERVEHLRAVTVSDAAGRFRDLVLDPVLVAAHLKRLEAGESSLTAPPALDPEELEHCRRALRVGPGGLTGQELSYLLGRPNCLRHLHAEAWCSWPVESWEVSRDRPQLPPLGSVGS